MLGTVSPVRIDIPIETSIQVNRHIKTRTTTRLSRPTPELVRISAAATAPMNAYAAEVIAFPRLGQGPRLAIGTPTERPTIVALDGLSRMAALPRAIPPRLSLPR